MTDEQTIEITLERLGRELARAERRLQRRAVERVVTRRAAPVLALCLIAALAVAGYLGQSSHAAGTSSSGVDVRSVISAFQAGAPSGTADAAEQRTLASLADEDRTVDGNTPPAGASMDMSRARVLMRGLGADGDVIAAAPSVDGSRACVALGSEIAGPVMTSCWLPQRDSQHFIASAPWTNLAGTSQNIVYGMAYDDVVSIRVDAGGVWHAVPLVDNAFFLALGGPVQRGLFTTIEATLRTGEVQTADLSAGM
jgi:hypothetical protein